MEMDEKMAQSLVKGYEAMPIALKAVQEQLEKMNGFLGSLTAKQMKEDEDAKKKEEEEKLIQRAVKELKKQGYKIEKAEALITGEANKIPTPPQSKEQEELQKKSTDEDKEDEEEDKKEEDKKEVIPPEIKAKAVEKCDEGKEVAKSEDLESRITAILEKSIPGIVDATLRKSGFSKAGFITKNKSFGVSELPIVKSEEPLSREKAIADLTKLSWSQLTELESQTQAGQIILPKIV